MKNNHKLPDIDALELATLAARLKQSGLIEANTPQQTLTGALAFLEASQGALNSWPEERASRKKQEQAEAALVKLIEGKKPGDRLPIAEVLKAAAVHRIALKPDELKLIGVKKTWGQLATSERMEAIFIHLTQGVVDLGDSTASLGSLERRKGLARDGVQVAELQGYAVDLLRVAHTLRTSKINAESGGKRQPRAPKGEGGKFTRKKRGAEGRFKPIEK